MNDTRQKYSLKIALANGQAFDMVTHMTIETVRTELKIAQEDDRRAIFDGLNPFTDEKVIVEIYTGNGLIAGLVHTNYHHPRPQPANPRLVQ